MFRRLYTLLGTCAFLALVTLQTPVSAQDRTSGVQQPDTTFWMTIKDTDLPDLFEMFIKRYPNSAHRTKAERQLRQLQGSAQPSALEQAKALIGKTPNRAAITRSVTAGAPRTRAPVLAAPVLALPAPIASTAATIFATPATSEAIAAITRPTVAPVLTPEVEPAAEPVTTTTAFDDAAQQDVAEEAPATPAVRTPVEQADEILPDELVILLQHHLRRVGCRQGSLDGQWGIISQKAAERFAVAVNEPLVTITPTRRLLRSVKTYGAGVCAYAVSAPPPAINRPSYYQRYKAVPRRATRTKHRIKRNKRVKSRRTYKKYKAATVRKYVKPRRRHKIKKTKRHIVKKARRHKKNVRKTTRLKKRKKIKVATKRKHKKRRVVKKTYKKKVYRKKSKKSRNHVGDPFNASLRAVGATTGGGWN